MDPDADLSPDRYAAPISGGRGGPPWPASGRRFRTRRHLIARIIFERAHRRRRSDLPGPAAAGPHRAGVCSRAVRRPSHAGSPAARSARCAALSTWPPAPRRAVHGRLASGPRPRLFSAVAHRLRRSDLPAPPRGAGVRTPGSGLTAGRRTPAPRPPGPFRCAALSTWPPAPRRAVHGRLAFRTGPHGIFLRRTAPGVPPASIPVLRPRWRGAGAARGGRSPAASRGGTCAGSDTPLPRPPGPFAALPLHLAPGLDGVSSGELCGLRGRRPTLPRSRACGPRGGFLFFPFSPAANGSSHAAGEKEKNMPSAVAIE